MSKEYIKNVKISSPANQGSASVPNSGDNFFLNKKILDKNI